MELSNQGLEPSKAADLIKDPYVLEILDLPESHPKLILSIEKAEFPPLNETDSAAMMRAAKSSTVKIA